MGGDLLHASAELGDPSQGVVTQNLHGKPCASLHIADELRLACTMSPSRTHGIGETTKRIERSIRFSDSFLCLLCRCPCCYPALHPSDFFSPSGLFRLVWCAF